MRRLSYKRLALLIGIFLLALFPNSGPPAVASPRASGVVQANEVTASFPALSGTLERQGGGVIQAADAGSTGGETLLFTSQPIAAGQLFDRIGLRWTAAPRTEDSFFLELRTSADANSWGEWQLLGPDEDMADLDKNEYYAPPQPAVSGARYAQYRVWLTDGSPESLRHVGVTFMDVNDLNAGPVARLWNDISGAARDIARSFTEPTVASAAPTGATRILTRQDWAADENIMRWIPRYQRVQKAVVHHTVTSDGGNNVAAEIRAIYYFHARTRGWGDIGYNYLVDKFGNVWTGRQGGDGAEAGHAYGWNKGTIGIAVIGTHSTTQPNSAITGAVANIIAMKFSQFGVQPFGSDPFVHQEQAPDGTWHDVSSNPPNVQGHRDCNYIQSQYGGQTACPGNALYAQLNNIRTMAQAAVQNGYVQMPVLEPGLAKAAYPGAQLNVGVVVTNKGKTAIPAGTRVSYRMLQRGNVVVPQGGSATLSATLAPGASTAVTVPFTTPALGSYVVRWDLQTGTTWWGPMHSTPIRDQWFRSADWSADWVSDNVAKSWVAGETRPTTVTVTNDGGRVWNATGSSPVRLGYKWVSNATGNTFPGAQRISLPGDVQPGQTVTLSIPVTAPVYPTNYTMTLDLYKEGEFAFADKGIDPDDRPVGVTMDYKAAYTFGSQPTFSAGQTVTVPVTVTNRGLGTFPITNANPVTLGYHWTTSSGANVIWDGARTKLPADLPAGQTVTLNTPITAPTTGGSFILKVDLVHEGVAWFSQKGVPTANTPVTIAGPIVPKFGAFYEVMPTIGMAGTQVTVPFVVTNTSNFTWPSAGPNPVRLSYHWSNPAMTQTVVWDGLRTYLPADLPPNGKVALEANVRLPSAPGNYMIHWDMVQEGVSWFSAKGVVTKREVVAVAPFVPPTYGAALDASQTPANMSTGLTHTVPVVVQNTSSFDWGTTINLSYHWLDGSGKAVIWDGARTPLAGMKRGETRTVLAQVAAPSAPGTYTLKWDVAHEGNAWFSGAGVQTPSRSVIVATPQLGATYLVPSAFNGTPNGTTTVPVKITNTGSLTWEPGKVNLAYHMYLANGALFVWDGARTQLPAALAPGQSVNVMATVRMPAAAGTYTVRFDMVQEGIAWFSGTGVPTGSATLQVQ